jgi:hypothetical protein
MQLVACLSLDFGCYIFPLGSKLIETRLPPSLEWLLTRVRPLMRFMILDGYEHRSSVFELLVSYNYICTLNSGQLCIMLVALLLDILTFVLLVFGMFA